MRTAELGIQHPIGTLGLFQSSSSESATTRATRLAAWSDAQRQLVNALEALGLSFLPANGAALYHNLKPTLPYPSDLLTLMASVTTAIPAGDYTSQDPANDVVKARQDYLALLKLARRLLRLSWQSPHRVRAPT